MYRRQHIFGPGGGVGGGLGAPQLPLQQQGHLNPNFFQNPNLFLLHQNPNLLAQLNPFLQFPNGFPQIQQQFPNINIPAQVIPENGGFQAQHLSECNNTKFQQEQVQQEQVKMQNEMVEEVDKAARRAWEDLVNSNESVSSWKVSQEALSAVKADSWESLGFQMQLVPSLKSLLIIEGKINAFVHCFVAARRVTTLYDLEVAICESEGVKQFEELELGPLLQHPLVVYYFSLTSNVTEVYRIRTEEVVAYLCEFIDTHNKKEHKVETFMDFICKKLSVRCWENLCVRVHNFRLYASKIKETKPSEDSVLEDCFEKLRTDSGKHRLYASKIKETKPSEDSVLEGCFEKLRTDSGKHRLYASKIKETKPSEDSVLEDCFEKLRTDSGKHSKKKKESFSSESTQFCGTHIRFASSSSEDDDDDSEDDQDEQNTYIYNFSLPNGRSVSSCPHPSANEEMRRLRLKSAGRSMTCAPDSDVDNNKHPRHKRRKENTSSRTALPLKLPRKEEVDVDAKLKSNHETNGPYWPPNDWKTAPGFKPVPPESHNGKTQEDDSAIERRDTPLKDISTEFNKKAVNLTPQKALLVEESNLPTNLNVVLDSVDLVSPDSKDPTPNCSNNNATLSAQAVVTGRLGEHIAFKYFMDKAGENRSVKWVNEGDETGLPYDIVLEGDQNTTEYIEVKATRIRRKDWFLISIREWQFAMERGESFSIAHVVLADDNMAKVTIYKNPARLCQLGNLKLAILVPK